MKHKAHISTNKEIKTQKRLFYNGFPQDMTAGFTLQEDRGCLFLPPLE
jgi:hypothetical protein